MAGAAAGFLVLAFILFSSLALGAASAWFLVWKTKKPTLWMLTPVFAFFWLMLVAVPLVGLGFDLPNRAAIKAAPVLVVPVPVQEVPATPPVDSSHDDEERQIEDSDTP